MIPVKKKLLEEDHSISFINLKAQQGRIRSQVEAALNRVLDHGTYILGPEIYELERQLSAFCGVKHTISCANGTDALALGLMAKGIGPGHAIFVPSFTFAATAEVVVWMGATPVFIDVLPDTYNMDSLSLEKGIQTAKDLGLKPQGVIPVDLFGQPADYSSLQAIADQHNLWVMADAAQSFGATYKGKTTGNIGDIATTSFFPAKPLGCYGDGGAIFTNDDDLAVLIKSIRVHGQGADKYDNVRIGMNGRLDTLQAAILLEKLKIFPDEIKARQVTADYYHHLLKDIVQVPHVLNGATSVWAQYTVLLPEKTDRTKLMAHLKERGIPTQVYYIKPLHRQQAYCRFPTAGQEELRVCDQLAERVLSLPICGYTKRGSQDFIAQVLHEFL